MRFSFDASSENSAPPLVTRSSAIGSITLSPAAAPASSSRNTDTALPPAELDFGMLKEAHSWQAPACAVPAGSTLEEISHGAVVQCVCIGCPVPTVSDGDRTANAPTALASQQGQDVLVTIKPEGTGEFSDEVTFTLVSAAGERQPMTVQVRHQAGLSSLIRRYQTRDELVFCDHILSL